MFLTRSIAFLLLSLGVLSACNVEPLYSEAVKRELAQIHVLPIAEREGQVLKIALNEQLDPQRLDLPTAYRLQLQQSVSVRESFSGATGARRARGTMRVTGSLVDLSGREIWSGTVQRAGLFARSDLPSLSASAQDDLWVDLADLIARDLRETLAAALRE